jgi:hypothetical protein
VHLQKLHQRPSDRHIVFDHHHEARGIFAHRLSATVPIIA